MWHVNGRKSYRARVDLPKSTHPYSRLSVRSEVFEFDGWVDLGKVVAGVLRRMRAGLF